MSVERAFRAGGVPAAVAKREAPAAAAAMRERGITTQARSMMFVAQVLHESVRLLYFEEIATGQAYDITVDPTLARQLGNVHPGDGRRFKGRGPIQLTGRANYRWAGRQLGLPLEQHPEMAAQHAIGWRIAALYWQSHGLNALADRGAFVTITERINGGHNGLAERQALLARVRRVDCRPAKPDPYAGATKKERRKLKRYDALVKAKKEHRSSRTLDVERKALWHDLARSRKAIWRKAQPRRAGGDGHGWKYASRRRRYALMKERTA